MAASTCANCGGPLGGTHFDGPPLPGPTCSECHRKWFAAPEHSHAVDHLSGRCATCGDEVQPSIVDRVEEIESKLERLEFTVFGGETAPTYAEMVIRVDKLVSEIDAIKRRLGIETQGR